MEWTRDKTLALISEYRKRRGLWDMTHDDYRKKDMKQKLLLEVAASLGDSIPVVEIEKKFHTLRTQYHREINRMKRKEPYNSKWFGFKNLQFLSSPKACRMGKGRVKSEITEEGTVTKYVIRESPKAAHKENTEALGGSVSGSNNNINEEFVSLQRKPTKINYEATSSSAAAAASSSRSRELEKLIEETTKDVGEVEEAKPKMPNETHSMEMEHHVYNNTVHSNGEMMSEQHTLNHQQQQQHPGPHEPQHHVEEEQHVENIDLQAGEEITYHASDSPGGSTHHPPLHHQPIPARIIKIQRRDTCPEEDYYEDDEHQHLQQQGHGGSKHRIYYETNCQPHTATILATPACNGPPASTSALLSSGHSATKLRRNSNGGSQHLGPSPQHQYRDDFSTYGEYVANEMRSITTREILIALKHKINTALFEANMAELQK